MKNFKIGDRVGLIEQYDNEGNVMQAHYSEDEIPEFGSIVAIMEDTVMVKWDGKSYTKAGIEEEIDPKLLFSEDHIKSQWSKLEKEFNICQEEIADKLLQAGNILEDAQKLAQKSGKDLASMWKAIKPLYKAMDKCGWRTSSFGC